MMPVSGALPLPPEEEQGTALASTSHQGTERGALGPSGCDLAQLYQSEAARLTRYLARRTGCREEARDLVHEAFSRVARVAGADPAGLERPAAYLQQVARNLLRDRAKTRARRAADLHVAYKDEQLPAPDPQRLLETRDMLRRLEAAMGKLKPRTREIFMAHRLDGLTYAEIAERTGLSIKGVEKQMSKAIAQLDRLLERA